MTILPVDHVILLMWTEVSEDEERVKKISNLLLQQNASVTKKLNIHRQGTPDQDVLEKVQSLNFIQIKPPHFYSYLIII